MLVFDELRLSSHQLVNELREEAGQLHVGLLLSRHVLDQGLVVQLDLEQLLACFFLLPFVVVDPLLKETRQVVLLLGFRLGCGGFFFFQNGDLVLVLLNYLLTEMGPLGQLILNLAVFFDLHAQQLQLLDHAVILLPDLLNVLRLVVEFGRELLVLILSHLRRPGQVLLVHGDHGHLHLLDGKQHLLAQRIDLILPLSVQVVAALLKVVILLLQLLLQLALQG